MNHLQMKLLEIVVQGDDGKLWMRCFFNSPVMQSAEREIEALYQQLKNGPPSTYGERPEAEGG